MAHVKKFTLAAFAAVLLLGLASGTAPALRSLRFSADWIEQSGMIWTQTAGGTRIHCMGNQTIHTIARSTAKTTGSVIGRAELKVSGQERREERCEGGRVRTLFTGEGRLGEYEVTYLSFNGTLPTITGLNFKILRVALLATVSGIAECLVTANVLGTLRVREGTLEEFSGPTSNVFVLESVTVRRVSGLVCPEPREVGLEGRLAPAGRARVELV